MENCNLSLCFLCCGGLSCTPPPNTIFSPAAGCPVPQNVLRTPVLYPQNVNFFACGGLSCTSYPPPKSLRTPVTLSRTPLYASRSAAIAQLNIMLPQVKPTAGKPLRTPVSYPSQTLSYPCPVPLSNLFVPLSRTPLKPLRTPIFRTPKITKFRTPVSKSASYPYFRTPGSKSLRTPTFVPPLIIFRTFVPPSSYPP